MSAAVAHGIRNPLASIRSSAELIPDGDRPQAARGGAHDIVAQSDRLEAWVRELLAYTRPLDEPARAGAAAAAGGSAAWRSSRANCERRQIAAHSRAAQPTCRRCAATRCCSARCCAACWPTPSRRSTDGGRIDGARRPGVRGAAAWSRSRCEDSGPGMTARSSARVGKPFYTTKARGLGVGLALARRVIERARRPPGNRQRARPRHDGAPAHGLPPETGETAMTHAILVIEDEAVLGQEHAASTSSATATRCSWPRRPKKAWRCSRACARRRGARLQPARASTGCRRWRASARSTPASAWSCSPATATSRWRSTR